MSKPQKRGGHGAGSSTVVHEKTSVLLKRIVEDIEKPKTQIGMLLYLLRRRSFGGLLLFLSLLSLIPGISFFTGLIIIVIGVQLAIGLRAPKLPRLFNEYELDVAKLKKLIIAIVPRIETVERFIKPRWYFFTNPPITWLLGVLMVGLALIVMLPLPFTGLLPVIAIILIALGLLERDGLFVVLGLTTSFLSIWVGIVIFNIALNAL